MSNKKDQLSKLQKANQYLFKLLLINLYTINRQTSKEKYTPLFNELCSSFGLLFLGLGSSEMITGREYAPLLIGTGFLLVAARIVFDARIQASIFRIFRWDKRLIYPFLSHSRLANSILKIK